MQVHELLSERLKVIDNLDGLCLCALEVPFNVTEKVESKYNHTSHKWTLVCVKCSQNLDLIRLSSKLQYILIMILSKQLIKVRIYSSNLSH